MVLPNCQNDRTGLFTMFEWLFSMRKQRAKNSAIGLMPCSISRAPRGIKLVHRNTPQIVPAKSAWGLLEFVAALCSVGIHGRDRLDGSKDTEILCLARFRSRAGAKGPRGLGGWGGETACALLGAAIPNSRCLTADRVLFLEQLLALQLETSPAESESLFANSGPDRSRNATRSRNAK